MDRSALFESALSFETHTWTGALFETHTTAISLRHTPITTAHNGSLSGCSVGCVVAAVHEQAATHALYRVLSRLLDYSKQSDTHSCTVSSRLLVHSKQSATRAQQSSHSSLSIFQVNYKVTHKSGCSVGCLLYTSHPSGCCQRADKLITIQLAVSSPLPQHATEGGSAGEVRTISAIAPARNKKSALSKSFFVFSNKTRLR